MQPYYIKPGCGDILPYLVDAVKDNTIYWKEFAGVPDTTRLPQDVPAGLQVKSLLLLDALISYRLLRILLNALFILTRSFILSRCSSKGV